MSDFKQIYVLEDQSNYFIDFFDAFWRQINADIEKAKAPSSSSIISI